MFEISFTPKGKELKYVNTNTWRRDGRQTGKPARIIQRLLRNKYKNRDLEIFNNLLKSEILNCGQFKIVHGDDIAKYYNEDTYFKHTGSLGNSCMRYKECSEYFDIYKDVAKLLICLKDDKLIGRAIIWELNDKILMDRIYTTDEYIEEQFIEYAKSNNWYYREYNCLLNSGDIATWMSPDNNYTSSIDLYENIVCPKSYKYYPYIDSFRYFDIDTNTISTNPAHGNARMDDTQGSYDKCRILVCANCGHSVRIWDDDYDDVDFYTCHYLDEMYCSDCCEYNEIISDYVPNTATNVTAIVKNFSCVEIPEEYINDRLIYPNQYQSSGRYFIIIDNKYYSKDCFRWSFDLNRYVLIDNEN